MTRTLAVLLILAGTIFAQDDPEAAKAKKAEEDAKTAIAEFNKSFKKARTDEEAMQAVRTFNQNPHPLILKELVKALKNDKAAIRKFVIFEIARYRKIRLAANALAKQLSAEAATCVKDGDGYDAGHDCFMAVCQALAGVAVSSSGATLPQYFAHRNLETAKAALRCAGEVKSIESIEPLINLLREWENAKVEDPYKTGNPAGGGGTGGPGFFTKTGGTGPANRPKLTSDQIEKIDKFNRKNQIPPYVTQSLESITGEQFKTAVEWAQWWAKNKESLLKQAKENAKKDPAEEDE